MKADTEPAAWGARKKRSHKTGQAAAADTWKPPHRLSPSRPYNHHSRSCSRFSCYLLLSRSKRSLLNRTPLNFRFDPLVWSEKWRRPQMRWCRRRCRGDGECELWIDLLCSPLQQKFEFSLSKTKKQIGGFLGRDSLLVVYSEIKWMLNSDR